MSAREKRKQAICKKSGDAKEWKYRVVFGATQQCSTSPHTQTCLPPSLYSLSCLLCPLTPACVLSKIDVWVSVCAQTTQTPTQFTPQWRPLAILYQTLTERDTQEKRQKCGGEGGGEGWGGRIKRRRMRGRESQWQTGRLKYRHTQMGR